jgi:fermentation-respiration switch protein FrsA (DUF1100 family)
VEFILLEKIMLKKPRKIILQFISLIILIYLSVIVFLFFYQRNLLYHPNENNYSGNNLNFEIEKVKIKTSDGIELLGWFHEKDLEKFKTIIFFHGNAGTLENRIYKLNRLKDLDINFLIIAWRGFSGNKGKPTEKNLYEDGKSAVQWIKNFGVENKNIILYGESLGTGIATEIAQNNDFAGVILETPFTSMADAASKFYPYIPVKLLLRDKYENLKKIKNIKSPILVMHGEVDQLVPFSMGEKIYKEANNPKYSYFTKDDDHMMEYDQNLIDNLNSFLKSLN